ncbi:MAG: Eco57I restriction-modification methylase domain-containing protein [Candidatus Thorarchaeota archaeon]
MQEFIDYLDNGIIRDLKSFYKEVKDNQNEEIFLNKVLRDLSCLNKTYLNDDIVIGLYENMRDHKERKKLGEFYTPNDVVDYILDGVGYTDSREIETKKLIDISCGSGSFIIKAIRRMVNRCLKINNCDTISELAIDEAKILISSIKDNIYGIDTNRIACILCQVNIHIVLFEILKHIQKSNPNYKLPLFNIINNDSLTIDAKIKYNYVVGNPPYLFIRDIPRNRREIIENRDFETASGQYDYYQIFIELGLKLLNNGGLFGYILPDSLLALSYRSNIRKYIYNTSKIKEIYYTGPKFNDVTVSNIIIILEKEKDALERNRNQMKIKLSNQQERFIPQKKIETWDYKFLIHLNNKDTLILKNLNINAPKLKDLNEKYGIQYNLSRGVELTKAGETVFCEKCNRYIPIPKKLFKCPRCKSPLDAQKVEKIIHDTIPPHSTRSDFKLYLYSIQRYHKTNYKYIDTSKSGISYKDLSNYKDRIIIRQISQNGRICATYDDKLSLTSQSFYNLKIQKSPLPEFNNFYLLGLINSALLSYFFIKSFGSYKKLFPRILIEKIKELPIVVPSSDIQKEKAIKLIEYVKNFIEEEEIEDLQRQVDFLVFDLYQVSEKAQKYIMDYLNSLNS